MSNPLNKAGNYLKNVAQAAGGLIAAVVPIFEEEVEALVVKEVGSILPASEASAVEAAADALVVKAGSEVVAETTQVASTTPASN